MKTIKIIPGVTIAVLSFTMLLTGCTPNLYPIKPEGETPSSSVSEQSQESAPSSISEQPQESISTEESHEGFTDEELNAMESVDRAIQACTNSEKFQNGDIDTRRALAMAAIQEQVSLGNIIAESVYAPDNNDMISFQYSCHVLGGIQLKDFDPMMN